MRLSLGKSIMASFIALLSVNHCGHAAEDAAAKPPKSFVEGEWQGEMTGWHTVLDFSRLRLRTGGYHSNFETVIQFCITRPHDAQDAERLVVALFDGEDECYEFPQVLLSAPKSLGARKPSCHYLPIYAGLKLSVRLTNFCSADLDPRQVKLLDKCKVSGKDLNYRPLFLAGDKSKEELCPGRNSSERLSEGTWLIVK